MNDRAPAWTGVEYLYNFLLGNKAEGPFAEEAPFNRLEIGDIVQLGTAAVVYLQFRTDTRHTHTRGAVYLNSD